MALEIPVHCEDILYTVNPHLHVGTESVKDFYVRKVLGKNKIFYTIKIRAQHPGKGPRDPAVPVPEIEKFILYE